MLQQPQTDHNALWKQRFRASTIPWAAVAENEPTRGLAITNKGDSYQLYAWNVPTGELTQLTNRAEGVPQGVLSPNGDYVYYLDDKQGNEIGHYVRIPLEGGAPEDITPDLPPYAASGITFSRSGNKIAMIVANAEGFHLYVLDIDKEGKPGTPCQLYHSKRIMRGQAPSYDGKIVVVGSSERSGNLDTSLLALDTASGQQIAELWDGPENSVESAMFSPLPNDTRLVATTNRSGVNRPLIWNPLTGERNDLPLDELEGEIKPIDWSSDGRRILLMQFHQAVQRLYLYDLEQQKLISLKHPNGSFSYLGGTFFGPEGEIFATWQDATHPSQLIALDAETGERTRTLLAAGSVPESHPWRSITFQSSDGQTIQGWLSMPEGEGPFPTILHTHGGPTAVTTEIFSPPNQLWVDHGFAFLTINYRGSTTFGREFEQQIWGDLGHWEIEDMAAARDWLVQQGIAIPDQIFLTGWSYGGYLTLLGLGKRPDLWAGGMAGIAIADWTMSYEDSADTLRGYQLALFSGTPEEKPDLYRRASPITYVEQVSAPVLIIQGRNDTRTPARPIRAYEARMKELGKPIEVQWFDAGHLAFTQIEQSIDQYEAMLRFAYNVLTSNEV
jgi:dipeptidyl aminopeptidase/acylaminoacyl peptidase